MRRFIALILVPAAFFAVGTASGADAPAVESASPAMSADMCLGCHGGDLKTLAEMTPVIKNEWDEIVQPHIYIDPAAGKPHASNVLPQCLECHTAHPFPPEEKAKRQKADYTYCYTCHHMETFEPCGKSGCHD